MMMLERSATRRRSWLTGYLPARRMALRRNNEPEGLAREWPRAFSLANVGVVYTNLTEACFMAPTEETPPVIGRISGIELGHNSHTVASVQLDHGKPYRLGTEQWGTGTLIMLLLETLHQTGRWVYLKL